jgi:hypothetical protein
MGDIGNLVGQVFGGSSKPKKPDYDPIDEYYGKDDGVDKAMFDRINASRANWNSLSDTDRAIATDEQKQFFLDYDKRKKERESLQQVSRIMDQRELRSKAIGGGKSGGSPQIVAGGGGSDIQPNGAKTKLGL